MEWSAVRTARQRDTLIKATLAEIQKLRRKAVREGLIDIIKVGESPVRAGSYADHHSLYLLPGDKIEHRSSVRDSMREEFVNNPPKNPNARELREVIPLCQMTPQSIKAVSAQLAH